MRRRTRGGLAARRRSWLRGKKMWQMSSAMEIQNSMQGPTEITTNPGARRLYNAVEAARRIKRQSRPTGAEQQQLLRPERLPKDGHIAARRPPAVPRSTSTSILRRVRAALGARIRGTTSLDARQRAEHPQATCLCTSSAPQPRSGRARTTTNRGQLVVLKARSFTGASCCPRRRAHAEHGRNTAVIRVRGGSLGSAARGRRAAPGSARPRSRCSRSRSGGRSASSA